MLICLNFSPTLQIFLNQILEREILSKMEAQQIFSNVGQLAELSRHMLDLFAEKPDCIGEAFVNEVC